MGNNVSELGTRSTCAAFSSGKSAFLYTRRTGPKKCGCYDSFTRRGVVSINMIVCLLPNASDVTGIVLEQKHAATATILVNDRRVFADRCFYTSNNGVLHYNVFIRTDNEIIHVIEHYRS